MKIKIGYKINFAFLIIALLIIVLMLIMTRMNRSRLIEISGVQNIRLSEELLGKFYRRILQRIEDVYIHFIDIDDVIREHEDSSEWETEKALREKTYKLIDFYFNNYSMSLIEGLAIYDKGKDEICSVSMFMEKSKINSCLNSDMEGKRYQICKMYYDKILKKPTAIVKIKLISGANSKEYYILLKVGLLDIFSDLEYLYANNFSTINRIITSDGRLVYSSGTFNFLEDVSSSDIYKNLSNESGYILSEYQNKEMLFSYSKKHENRKQIDGFDFFLLTGSEVETISSNMGGVIVILYAAAFVLIISSIVAGLILSRSISTPLNILRDATLSVKSGNFSTRVYIETGDEIEDLAGNFNLMISDLQKYYDELKKNIINLNKSNEELKQYAYVASHDLQEPLRSIAGFLQIIENKYKDKLDEKGVKYIRRSVNASERMQNILRDLLYYSNVNIDRNSLEPVDTSKAFDEIIKELSEEIEKTKALITKVELPVIRASYKEFKALLKHLISNALRYQRPEVPPNVRVVATKLEDKWRFRVLDNGMGIEEQYFERIFSLFQRLNARKDYSGTGIGLAICKRIVESLGGEIWLESKPGAGSTFNFTIPFQE